MARTIFGGALLLCGSLFAAYALYLVVDFNTIGQHPTLVPATVLLGAAWSIPTFVWGLFTLFKKHLKPLKGDDSFGGMNVALFSSEGIVRKAYARRIGVWSLALPIAGVSLLAPISFHVCIYFLCSPQLTGFENWVRLSAFFVGFAHLAIVGFAFIFASRKVQNPTQKKPSHADARPGWYALVLAIAVATLQCVIVLMLFGNRHERPFFFIPPVVVAFTGLFLPALYAFIGRRFDEEERTLAKLRFR